MSLSLKVLHSYKLTGQLTTNFACEISKDDRILIVADTGILILSQKPNLNSIFQDYMCHKYFLEPSTFALSENLDIDIYSALPNLPKDVLYEATLSSDLTNETPRASPKVVYAQWSDCGMVDNAHSMLALLTTFHSLEIYIKVVYENDMNKYEMILNLTNDIINLYKKKFIRSTRLTPVNKVKELEKRVEQTAPITFVWSHMFSYHNKNCAVIFVGHFHGTITAWRISCVESYYIQSCCDFLCTYNSKLGNISTLYWHKTSEYDGALCIGDRDGKLSVVQVKNLEQDICHIENEVEFYTEKDRQIDKITVMMFDTYTILIAVKQHYLLLYGLDKTGQVFDLTTCNVNNLYITSVTHNSNILKVLTLTGVFKELKLSIQLRKIVIEDNIIPVKFDFSGYRSHGFVESHNRVLYSLILGPYYLQNALKGGKYINFILLNDVNINPLKLLLDNKTHSLRNFWDCFEALRLICIKEERFPWLGLKSDFELDNMSITQLKTMRLIAKLSETVFSVVKKVACYEIKPYILLHYLVDLKRIGQRLAKLFKDKSEGKQLSLFQLRSIDLQVFFLKELVISGILPKAQVGNTFIKEITHILSQANEIKFPDMIQCYICGEKLIGSTCLPPHMDSRCVFTMMPIFLEPAYKCSLCSSLAHNEMKIEMPPFCPYCDFPMDRICADKNITENMDSILKVSYSSDEVTSQCVSECMKDSQQLKQELYLHLEDNEISFVNISDDESNDASKETELEKLYYKMSHINIGDSSSYLSKILIDDIIDL